MKYLIIFSFSFTFCLSGLQGQTHFDFTVTDTEGNVHSLYQHYLDNGKTVVLKLFFVGCPPCNEIAKDFQAKYVEWGEGQHDVQFMEVTTLSGDDDNDVKGYKAKHGITFPSISAQGGAIDVSNEYKSGFFGTYWGTPSFAVIAPDGQTDYGAVPLSALDDIIAATGAEKPGTQQGTNITIDISWSKDQPGDINSLSVILQSINGGTSYDLMALTNGTLQFDYPSEQIPELVDPSIIIDYTENNNITKGVTASDITVLRKHILGITPFTESSKVLAADVNGDNKVSSIDIITLRKVILGFDLIFPNDVRSYVPESNRIGLQQDPGAEIVIPVKMIKMGDLN